MNCGPLNVVESGSRSALYLRNCSSQASARTSGDTDGVGDATAAEGDGKAEAGDAEGGAAKAGAVAGCAVRCAQSFGVGSFSLDAT